MLCTQIPQSQRIILASGSPRRVEILRTAGLQHVEVIPSTFEENLDKSLYTPITYVIENAKQKALEVQRRMGEAIDEDAVIIGADTVVVRDNTILEKPASYELACEMLASLSDRQHEVVTGVTLLRGKDKACVTFHELTQVTFAKLDDAMIKAYVDTHEPMDKAGGYGMQSVGGAFVSGIQGCYFNVVGFPLHRFCQHLHPLLLLQQEEQEQ